MFSDRPTKKATRCGVGADNPARRVNRYTENINNRHKNITQITANNSLEIIITGRSRPALRLKAKQTNLRLSTRIPCLEYIMKLAWKAGQSWYSVFTRWPALARWSLGSGWSSYWQFHRRLYDAVVASSTAAVDLQLTVAVLTVAVLTKPVTLAAQPVTASSLRLLPGLTCCLAAGRE